MNPVIERLSYELARTVFFRSVLNDSVMSRFAEFIRLSAKVSEKTEDHAALCAKTDATRLFSRPYMPRAAISARI